MWVVRDVSAVVKVEEAIVSYRTVSDNDDSNQQQSTRESTLSGREEQAGSKRSRLVGSRRNGGYGWRTHG